MPTAPVATSVVFSKSTVKPGEEILATVMYTPGTSVEESTFTGMVTSRLSGLSSEVTGTFMVEGTETDTVAGGSDTGKREWTLVSNDGHVAVFSSRG